MDIFSVLIDLVQDDSKLRFCVGRTIGCWSWSESDAALVRDDGAALCLLGPTRSIELRKTT